MLERSKQIVSILGLILVFLFSIHPAVQATAKSSESENLFGGVEIGSKGVKATAIEVSRGEEGYNVKLVYSEVINTTIMQLKDNKFAPEVIKETAAAVNKLVMRMQNEYKLLPSHISIIGSSGLRADNPSDLIKAVKEATGKDMDFLDVESEVQLSIAGTVPQRYRTKYGWTDNRGVSMLVDIGSGNTKGGYQILRQTNAGAGSDYDYVTVGIPKGTVSFTNEVNKAIGENSDLAVFAEKARELAPKSVAGAMRSEMERKPGLFNRRRVYLTGGIVWAATTILRPADRRAYVPLTTADINQFYALVHNPQALQAALNPDLSRTIKNAALRKEAEKELESVRNAFTPKNLIAGSEILKAVSAEFNLPTKRIRFARYGYLSWILSYVRLTAE